MKKTLIVTIVLVCVVGGLMMSFTLLRRHIFNRTDCERFNIDNIELRTGIDIPAVDSSSCECGESVKRSYFYLHSEKVDIEQYISRFEWQASGDYYVMSGDDEYSSWQMQLEPDSRMLKVYLEYRSGRD